jgi:hypothetical protein
MYHKGTILSAFSDQSFASVRIVVNQSDIGERQIQAAHVTQTGRIPANHDFIRNAVPAASDPTRDPFPRRVRRWQPKKQQGHPVSGVSAFLEESHVSATRTRRFECEAPSRSDVRINPFDHGEPGRNGGFF